VKFEFETAMFPGPAEESSARRSNAPPLAIEFASWTVWWPPAGPVYLDWIPTEF